MSDKLKQDTRAARTVVTTVVKGSVDVESGEANVIMSTDSLDRHKEVVMQDGWDLGPYEANPVLLSSHNYESLLAQIGKGLEVGVGKKGLEGRFKWFNDEGNKEADWGFKLVEKGVAAFSVGFIPKQLSWGDEIRDDEDIPDEIKDKMPFAVSKKQELIELSQVVVPANADALLNMYGRSDGFIRNYVKTVIATPDLYDFNSDQKKLFTFQEEILEKDAKIKEIISSFVSTMKEQHGVVEIDAVYSEQVDKIVDSINELKLKIEKLEGVETKPEPKVKSETGAGYIGEILSEINNLKEFPEVSTPEQ